MTHLLGAYVCCSFILLATTAPLLADAPTAPPDPLAADALLILSQNCHSCHNPEKHKGGLVLTSRDGALKGGKSGPAIQLAEANDSPLLRTLAPNADPHMPPKGQLTPDEIDTLRRWIDAGLPWSHVAQPPATRPVTLRPIPAAYHPVLAIAIAPDGKRLAIARGDRAIIVDLAAEQSTVLAQCTTANEPVYALAWSPNGNLLAVGGYRHVRLWNLKSAAPVRSFDHLPGRITALAFTPDARTLLAADGEPAADGIVRQWSLDDPAASATWTAHRDSITSLRISADGARLVTASADKLVRIWDRAARKEIATLEGHSSPVMAVALNADATRLVSAGADREMKIWDTTTRQLVASLTSSPTGVADLCWLDEKRILSASDDGLVRLTSQDDKSRAQRTFTGAADVIYCLALSPDQKTVYAGCHDGKVYAWTLANGKLQRTIAPGTSAD